MTKYCGTLLTTELTELCSSMSRILTLYFGLNPEVPLISDKFTSALIYILNASSYDGDISVPSRDSLWRLSLSLLSSLPLPPPLPPTVVSVLCHLLRTDKPQTARSILNTLPRLVPHLNPDNLEPLCHVVFSLWSHKFKPCPALVNSVLALTSRRGPQHGPLLLEYDILDDVHVRLKQFYVSLECSHGDNVLCTEMDIYLQLLNNILCQHPHVCEIAAKAGLADTLHKLLGWVLTSETTLSALLQVMASFTSNCLQACNSCVHTSTLMGSGLSKSLSSSSLVHSLIALVVTYSPHNAEVRMKCLRVLGHLMAANDCRHIVSKSSLFDHFTDVALKKLSPPLEHSWLFLLKSYSYHLSPYNPLLDNPNFLDLLISKTYTNLHYLIVLTNISFHPGYQAKLMANAGFGKLLEHIFSDSEQVSVNRHLKLVRAKLEDWQEETNDSNGNSNGKDVRAINEKLFEKYFELLLFDNALNRGQRRGKSPEESLSTAEKSQNPGKSVPEPRKSRSKKGGKTGRKRCDSGDKEVLSDENSKEEAHGSDGLSGDGLAETLLGQFGDRREGKENNPSRTNIPSEKEKNPSETQESSSRSQDRSKTYDKVAFDSELPYERQSYESYRKGIPGGTNISSSDSTHNSLGKRRSGTNLTNVSSNIDKYVKLFRSPSGAHTILDTNRTILDQILSHASHPGLENAHFNSLIDFAKAYDTVLLEELIRIVKRNAALIVWNLAANNYKTKLHFRHIGLVNCLQNCAKVDEDFRKEYGYVIGLLMS
ncbi:hypothetical protein M8J76_008781 [Diaphorina citri]|nr:hypothetical protein M8J76_008781 [Diaphorina citri]